jgi:glyoxylase-like metal-dependent hydrolase (beta-lactamase superfamily II)
MMGDMHVVATYSGWKDFGGAMAPAKIVQTRGGWPFFDVDVAAATLNPPDVAALVPAPPPPAGRGGGAPPAGRGGGPPAGAAPGGPPAMNVTVEKLGEGLHRLTTGAGSYDSLLIEFKDYVMILEAGQSEARSVAYIAETKKLFPAKPLRYVWNSHPHSDHTGGLPAYVAEGVTIVTQQNNKAFFEKALNSPRTLLNDSLAKNPKKVRIETVAAKKVYSDGTRSVEFHHVYPSPHSNGLTIAIIPKEKILFQGDYTLPAAGQQPNDHVRALQAFVEKMNIDFEQYVSVHRTAAPQTKADLWKAVGK